MFGISGSHRSGKSTLAKDLAENLGLHFFETSTTKVMREIGINAVGDLPIDQRIAAQEYVLKRHVEEIDKLPRPAISDRTPLDMAAYMLGEVTMNNTPIEFSQRIENYVNQCIRLTALHYDTVFIVRPLDGYAADPTKPPPNRAYQWAHQLLVEGAAQQLDSEIRIATIQTLDHRQRMELAAHVMAQRVHDWRVFRESRPPN